MTQFSVYFACRSECVGLS